MPLREESEIREFRDALVTCDENELIGTVSMLAMRDALTWALGEPVQPAPHSKQPWEETKEFTLVKARHYREEKENQHGNN